MPARIIKSGVFEAERFGAYQRGELQEFAGMEAGADIEAPEPEPDPEEVRAEILAEARREAEAKVKEAYAEGLRRGAEAGKAEFLEAVGQSAEAFRSAGEAMRLAHEEFLGSFEPAIVTLARAAAERVLRRELRHTDAELIHATIRAALRLLNEQEKAKLHLNPNDIAALEEHGVELNAEMANATKFDVVPDSEVASGGCVIESDTLRVDAQLEEQLARIFNAIGT
jgi:flagellar assembly protein FliH